MGNTFFILIFTVGVLLLIGCIFLYFHLLHLQHEVIMEWQIVSDKLRLRLDKIPNLVETVRKYTDKEDVLLNELIELRAVCWPINKSDKNKISTELEISDKINSIWQFSKKYLEMNKDMNFLALKMEFKEISQKIERALEIYNNKVRSFNGNILLLVALPLMRIFGLKKLNIFEFES